MLWYGLVVLSLLGSTFQVLPDSVNEIGFMVVSFITAVLLFRQSHRVKKLTLTVTLFAIGTLVIGLANSVWVYASALPEWPAWADFYGNLAISSSYIFFLAGCGYVIWNVDEREGAMGLGFSCFVAMVGVAITTTIAFADGLLNGYEAGTSVLSVAFVFFSGTLFLAALITLLRVRQKAAASLLFAFSGCYFLADWLYARLPEAYGSGVWNSAMTVGYALLLGVVPLLTTRRLPLWWFGREGTTTRSITGQPAYRFQEIQNEE
jgi:hypothetical protein